MSRRFGTMSYINVDDSWISFLQMSFPGAAREIESAGAPRFQIKEQIMEPEVQI
jgi:hypothetical protein